MCPILDWSTHADGAIVEAINGFGLIKLGWKGFDELPWVAELHVKYPALQNIALHASSALDCKLQDVADLFAAATTEDRRAIRSYFVGKLALEKLSCNRSGAGAGMCDKFGAFLKIFELTMNLVR
ncbi:MAG: hypothetical protein K2Y39_05995 [Candidatus Obscuribacterales bacterium]|nr:hypothetical protein [Candidatus Obscuribacterales bacterium]